MADNENRPICLTCGKPLRKLMRQCTAPADLLNPWTVGDDPKATVLAWLCEHPDRLQVPNEVPVAVIKIKQSIFDLSEVRVTYWTRLWGSYGDDRFCGLSCGWTWAVQHAPRPEKSR